MSENPFRGQSVSWEYGRVQRCDREVAVPPWIAGAFDDFAAVNADVVRDWLIAFDRGGRHK